MRGLGTTARSATGSISGSTLGPDPGSTFPNSPLGSAPQVFFPCICPRSDTESTSGHHWIYHWIHSWTLVLPEIHPRTWSWVCSPGPLGSTPCSSQGYLCPPDTPLVLPLDGPSPRSIPGSTDGSTPESTPIPGPRSAPLDLLLNPPLYLVLDLLPWICS